jgi:type IV pilus assembly protein PilP
MKPRKNSLIVPATVLALLFVVASGCGKKENLPPPEAAKAATTLRTPVQNQISTAAKPSTQERYDFTGKKDPFRSYVVVSKVKLPLPPVTDKHLPIQQYEVNQFKILGIITGLAENRAMVLDPAGKSYVVKDGSFIGPNNGRVQKIMPTFVEVSEQYREDNGKIKTRVVRLTLPRKE